MAFILQHTALSLRPIAPADEALLCAIYSSTRTAEMERVAWSETARRAFLEMQFKAQHQWYQSNYAGAFFWLIYFEGQPVGRLYLHPYYTTQSMRIIDIALLPEWRNKGWGSSLLKEIMAWAEREEKSVSIHVESFNPAKKLYQKLGFRFVSATNGVYHLMEWKAPQTVLS